MTTHIDAPRSLFDAVEPDIAEQLAVHRTRAVEGGTSSTNSRIATALAIGSVPVMLAALSREAGAQSTGVTAVLNFALMLEIFENEFYKAVLGTSSSTAQNNAFATVRATVPAAALPALQQIQRHEASHVAFLQANGATNVLNLTAASFDFTGARGAGNGPFARATTELAFLLLVAQAAEDTGVRAYKGQAGALQSNTTLLEAALRIHSVEARHASKIRRLRRSTGAPSVVRYSGTVSTSGAAAAGAGNISSPPQAVVDALNLIYAGETSATQGTATIANLPNLPAGIDVATAASEAFDEILTKAQVTAIVQPFFIPTIP